jgi:thiamine pyrophosphate-dependent acetolactate synthase large subunit-like protein
MSLQPRTGGQILVDQLLAQGVERVTCVPGESYLAVLDALHDAAIDVLVCRNEGGASMMADAVGKLTGRPGICFVTRGPGATNASPGVHIAKQDSTPLILFVGQVGRLMREREAFQELDYRAAFGPLAKWATEVDDPARIPEIVARAYRVAMQGRPGPVVIALPEDSDHSGRTHLHRGPVADDKDVAGPSAEQRAEADHVGDALLVRDILPAPALYSSDHAKAGSGKLRFTIRPSTLGAIQTESRAQHFRLLRGPRCHSECSH